MADDKALLRAKAHTARRASDNRHTLGASVTQDSSITLRCTRCLREIRISPSIAPKQYIVAGEALSEACVS